MPVWDPDDALTHSGPFRTASGGSGHEPSSERREALIALLERVGPVADSGQRLARFPWDCDGELAVLTADHIVRTLQAFLSGQLSEDDVETWAEALQGRDDLGLDPTRADDLKQALFELSTPQICGPTTELAASWVERLTAT